MNRSLRRRVGLAAFLLGLLCIVWLVLGFLDVVPFVLQITGETPLRIRASAAVACLLVAAWAFWND